MQILVSVKQIPDAPTLKNPDFTITKDWHEVLPGILGKIQKVKGEMN
ncbi:MAG: hypothetical protein HOG03_00430 [Desulfobacula sp.]|jgi:hypothetical protein|nr:hypothetical protein [Desulfobacula sp.]MBT3483855.1 hypothetical protein [Desulfobacula sp.]MBT3803043.1 hypothetical protein [Desulfobacula sp.]MBT4023444.1 hypothetical protein [Desulfobacula sp.]MBT4197091.1 hypothetical protein [Desulfobacula sp.]